MHKQILSIILLSAIISCTSAEKEKPVNNSDLSEKKAKELIIKQMDTPEGNVGGTFTDVKK